MKYFIYEREQHDATFYGTEEQWKKEIEDFDFLGKYCDDGWTEEVEWVIAGKIPDGVQPYDPELDDMDDYYEKYQTHQTEKFDERQKPDDLDEDNYSPSQQDHWPNDDWDFICNYHFVPVKQEEAKNGN